MKKKDKMVTKFLKRYPETREYGLDTIRAYVDAHLAMWQEGLLPRKPRYLR